MPGKLKSVIESGISFLFPTRLLDISTCLSSRTGFPSSSAGKESALNAGDPGSIPGSGSSTGEGNSSTPVFLDLPGGSDGKESACNLGDGFYPWVGRPSREGNSNPLQCSCLESPMDRGAWQATVPRVAKSQT